MARTSDGPTAIAFMESLVKRDRAAVVCDLLFCSAGSGCANLGEDLAIARDIGLDGVDLYALNVLPNTPLGKTVENGRTTVPSPAERRDLYLQGCDFMDDAVGAASVTATGAVPHANAIYNLLIKQGADCHWPLVPEPAVRLMVLLDERTQSFRPGARSVAAGKKPLMMIMRNAERNAQWRHTLQSGIETARVPLDELTPHAEKLAPLLAQWHQKA